MSTWEKVLDLSGISNSVYGVQTSMKSPYFVVWYQNGDAVSNRKVSGLNMAYLYSKENTNEIVGVVPNYVASTMDGNVIVFDGDHTLYKVPLYSVEELVKKQRHMWVSQNLQRNRLRNIIYILNSCVLLILFRTAYTLIS